ncbi:hypothetical protein MMIC_P0846 [Mariprofundus micogutta]|uniref:Glycosyltransferase subfamily 4-like N-terminal domain-containing protein n=1 Tax=Mariprofundus micogutta TaxID=1921010 RepID=A0A1L8CLU3_9PROT|nr:glycosyltransferase family 4 protein [Mariprofundus micogutta]GAV19888.1 hypothetical protein MMIC_P0846 [Mariprofundus micogutta]
MIAKNNSVRVLVISIGYVPYPTPSDKNFVHELIGSLSNDIDLAVWSLNDAKEVLEKKQVGSHEVIFQSKNRIFHRPQFSDQLGSYQPHKRHSNIRNGLEMNLSLLWHSFFSLRAFIKAYKPSVLHFTDSVGPVLFIIKKLFPSIPITVTKPTMRISLENYSTGGIYKNYVKYGLIHATKLITYTRAAADELQKIGCEHNALEVIPWGVRTIELNSRAKIQSAFRKRYSCKPEDLLIVVSDRLPEQELFQTLSCLRSSKFSNVLFVVAIRPTRYKEEYRKYSGGNVVVENGPKDFHELLEAADGILSPVSVSEAMSTSLLPLTWIEAMLKKTPIITSRYPGVDDLIQDRENGFIYNALEDLPVTLDVIRKKSAIERIRSRARETILSNFDLELIAKRYADIWKNISRGN